MARPGPRPEAGGFAPIISESIQVTPRPPLDAELEDFVDCVRSGRHPVVDGAIWDEPVMNLAHAPWYRQVNAQQWRAFLATFFGWLLDGFDFTIMTFILVDIQNSFTVDAALAGALGTVTLLFRLVGGLGAGMMADRWGRKLPLMLSISAL